MATLVWSVDNVRAEQGLLEFGELVERKQLRLMEAIEEKVGILTEQMYQMVEDKLSGGVLNVVTGALLSSVVLNAIQVSGMSFEGSVEIPEGSPEHLIGLVHELGGEGYYIIEPVNAQALAFVVDGKLVITRRVNHPPALQRSFLRSTLDEMGDYIFEELNQTATEVLEGVG